MKIFYLCGNDINSKIIYSFLNNNYQVVGIIQDVPISKSKFIKKRIKKLGFFKVLNQLIFVLLIVPILRIESMRRTKEILYKVKTEAPSTYAGPFFNISVNNIETINIIDSTQPDLIVVNGTKIISKTIIESINVPIINVHVGVTPKYRGVHGGYWALRNNDKENFGVTVHLLDAGIDTGGVISQKKVEIDDLDNFVTYPILQTIKGLECLLEAIKKIKSGDLVLIHNNNSESKLYYHPTALEYLKARLINKIK